MKRATISGGPSRRSTTSNAILQKANSQLRGQRVSQSTAKDDDEDDIGAYLSSLSKKTKEPQWDKFGEVSDLDLSVSSDDQKKTVQQTSASKFLKKKAPPPVSQDESKAKSSVSGPKKAGTSQHQPLAKSSALSKAAAFVSKFSERPKKQTVVLSDSDLDMDLSMDSDIVSDVQAMRQSVKKPEHKQPASSETTSSKKVTPQKDQKPQDRPSPKRKLSPRKDQSSDLDNDSISIGIDGAKFTKKTPYNVHGSGFMSDSSSSDAIGKGGAKFMKKKARDPSPPPSPEKTTNRADSPPRQSMFKLRSSERYATQVMLDTDEESLADFIGGLSSSTDPGSARTPRTPKSPVSARHMASSKFMKPKLSPVGRPSPEPFIGTIKEVDEASEKDSSVEEESFKINIHDLNDLEPVEEIRPSKERKKKRDSVKTPRGKGKEKPKDKKKSVKGGASDSPFFSSVGLHTVDELLADSDVSEASEVVSEHFETGPSPAPLRSILSPTPRTQTPRRVRLSLSEVMEVRSRSPSPEPVSTARAVTSRIYTEDFEEEYSESARSIDSTTSETDDSIHTVPTSGRSTPSRSRYADSSRVRTEDYYSDDFTEMSATSRRQMYSSRSSSRDSVTYSEDYTSYVESTDRSRTPSPDTSRVSPRSARRHSRATVDTRSVRVQTAQVPGLWYRWDADTAGNAAMTPPLGLGLVDPTPIASHVVSADALEALTAYSPSVLVLNDMLRQQLQLTHQFIDTQRRMYRAYVGAAVPDFKYTTLEETKQYIAKHRKPKLTFDEALRQVKEEMDLH